MTKKITISLFLSLVLFLTACSLSLAQDAQPPPGYQPPVYEGPEIMAGAAPISTPNPENGHLIYEEKCLVCHGSLGLGDGPDSTGLPNEVARIGAANVTNLASPLKWYSLTLQGNMDRFMPPFSGSLSSEDVWDVLAYVYTLSVDPEVVADGAVVFTETCAACHGADGTGGGAPGVANLRNAERMVLLSVDDLVQKIATGNGNDQHVFSTVLDADHFEAAALYVRSLTFPLEGEAVAASAPEPTEVPEEADEAGTETEAAEDAEGGTDPEDSAADQPDDGLGTVTGVVVNGSGGELPDGLEVRLEVYESFEIVYEEIVAAQADGSYRFEGVEIDPNLVYITVVERNGAFFPSAFHMGDQTLGETIDLPIEIYDITSETDGLIASRIHVFFQFSGGETVQVIHQVTISNTGTKMIAPERDAEPVVQFTLPEGARSLVFQSGTLGNPYVQTTTGFADPTPILPGVNSYEILFAYDLPFDGKLDWQLPVDLPVGVAVLFVQGEHLKIKSDTVQSSGTESFEQDVFQVFIAEGLSAGQVIDLRIDTPLFGGGQGMNDNWLTIALGIVGLGLAGFGAWRFFAPIPEEEYDNLDGSDTEPREDLIEAIIALDEAYEAGEITEEAYHTNRDPLKQELTRLVEEEGED